MPRACLRDLLQNRLDVKLAEELLGDIGATSHLK
jgi:hypothetical protein